MNATTATESNGSPQQSRSDNPKGSAQQNIGRIEEIQGVVIDVVFPERLPEINHAITIARTAAGAEEEAPGISSSAGGSVLVCEVQQHLGDDRVRAVAMDTTDGLARGSEVIDTGGPITVPVGEATLGRIFNLLGKRSISARSCPRTSNAGAFTARRRWRWTSRPRARCSRPGSR